MDRPIAGWRIFSFDYLWSGRWNLVLGAIACCEFPGSGIYLGGVIRNTGIVAIKSIYCRNRGSGSRAVTVGAFFGAL